jgi:hypothetical protein
MNTAERVAKRAKELLANNPRANPLGDADNAGAFCRAICEEIDACKEDIKHWSQDAKPQCSVEDVVSCLRALARRWDAEWKAIEKGNPASLQLLKCQSELEVALDWCEDGNAEIISGKWKEKP